MDLLKLYRKIPKRYKTQAKTIYFSFQKIRKMINPLPYPINSDGKVLIHLGCGELQHPKYINVDGRYFPHVHHISRVEELSFFPDNFADLIYTSHTLEHIKISQLIDVLIGWKRILKNGGQLRISVPDFDTILQIYNDNNKSINLIWSFLLGHQDYKENFHYSVFNKTYLTDILKEAGFTEVKEWDPSTAEFYDFDDWASRKIILNDHEYKISLNLEAIK